MYEITFEFRSVGLCGGFLFVSLFVPFVTSLPAYFFIYLFLLFFFFYFFLSFFYFFALSLCHSFYFFSIFLEPEPKLFYVLCVPRCSGVFRSVPECFGVPVFRCSGVPVFLVLVLAILLIIFDNA